MTDEEQFKFPNLASAQEWSRQHYKMIYVELFGIVGVFQIYPGGRTIKWPSQARFWKRLTPASEFNAVLAAQPTDRKETL